MKRKNQAPSNNKPHKQADFDWPELRQLMPIPPSNDDLLHHHQQHSRIEPITVEVLTARELPSVTDHASEFDQHHPTRPVSSQEKTNQLKHNHRELLKKKQLPVVNAQILQPSQLHLAQPSPAQILANAKQMVKQRQLQQQQQSSQWQWQQPGMQAANRQQIGVQKSVRKVAKSLPQPSQQASQPHQAGAMAAFGAGNTNQHFTVLFPSRSPSRNLSPALSKQSSPQESNLVPIPDKLSQSQDPSTTLIEEKKKKLVSKTGIVKTNTYGSNQPAQNASKMKIDLALAVAQAGALEEEMIRSIQDAVNAKSALAKAEQHQRATAHLLLAACSNRRSPQTVAVANKFLSHLAVVAQQFTRSRYSQRVVQTRLEGGYTSDQDGAHIRHRFELRRPNAMDVISLSVERLPSANVPTAWGPTDTMEALLPDDDCPAFRRSMDTDSECPSIPQHDAVVFDDCDTPPRSTHSTQLDAQIAMQMVHIYDTMYDAQSFQLKDLSTPITGDAVFRRPSSSCSIMSPLSQ